MTPETLPYATALCDVNELRMEFASAGKASQPVVILLHGFPDLWQGWHFQIGPLVAAGYRVLAPNQRGYGATTKPKGILSYGIDELANDVIAFADSQGCQTFCLVGHDWGGIVAWWVAARFPDRVTRLVILNAPHPGIFFSYLLRHPGQVLRSWYIGFFQLPLLPEAILSAANYSILFQSLKNTSQQGVFDESDRKYLVAGWLQPGALTAMIDYYRAAARKSSNSLQQRIRNPTLILWGMHDSALQPGLAEVSLKLCENGRIVWLAHASHWIQREDPECVNHEILAFIHPTASG
ncbi:MAG: Soluble epoxide hydrolase [Planctomycetaceae bacterium]|nr:Soluble epoxide hydrolase [Planctomycetaceae bacterium]